MDVTTLVGSPVLLASLLVGVVLPALVALVTKQVASSGLKAWVLLALSAVSAVAVQVVQSGAFNGTAAVNTFLITFVTAVAAHYGLLKPAGLTGTDGVIQTGTANVGLGGSPDPEETAPTAVDDKEDLDELTGDEVEGEPGVFDDLGELPAEGDDVDGATS